LREGIKIRVVAALYEKLLALSCKLITWHLELQVDHVAPWAAFLSLYISFALSFSLVAAGGSHMIHKVMRLDMSMKWYAYQRWNQNLKQVARLDLSANGVTKGCSGIIADLVKGDALGLVRLDLRHNELGDEGAIELGAALADEGSRLQHLDLRYSSRV